MNSKQLLMEAAGNKIGHPVIIGLINGHIVQGVLHEITSDTLIFKDEKALIIMFNAQGNQVCEFSSLTIPLAQIYGISD